MNQNIKLIAYSVSDISTAKSLYSKFLNTEPYVDSPYYVGFKVSDLEIGLTPTNGQNLNSPIVYTDVSDIAASLKTLADAGAIILQDVREVGPGLRVASVKDSDGNVLGLRQQK